MSCTTKYRKSRKPLVLDRIAGVLAVCASILGLIFIITYICKSSPNLIIGGAGIACTLLSRSIEDIVDWLGARLRVLTGAPQKAVRKITACSRIPHLVGEPHRTLAISKQAIRYAYVGRR